MTLSEGDVPGATDTHEGVVPEWTPGGDPMLALLPPEPPWAFQSLPREEQQWRARVFLAVWINTGGLMFAWAQALRNGPDDANVNAWVLRYMTDEVILDGLRSLQPSEPTTPSSRE